MAGKLNKLESKELKGLVEPGRHSDGGGLYLKVSKAGTKHWVFMYVLNGRQREMGLGRFDNKDGVSLANARAKAQDLRKSLAAGVDPLDARQAEQEAERRHAVTFGEFADQYVKDHAPSWSNPKHRAQWAMTLGVSYCAAIRHLTIPAIGVPEVVSVLEPIWTAKPETASRLRMRIERILDAARVKGLRDGPNPAQWRGNLDHVLARPSKARVKHYEALPYTAVPDFYATLDSSRGVSAMALAFLISTATRTGEVLGARWSEVDLDAGLWVIPGARMKARRAHRVPLSEAAVAAVTAVRGLHGEIVFPGPSLKAQLSNMALLMLLRKQGFTATAHGFRSAFRDWVAEETSFPPEVAEMALAHIVANQTEAAYRRGDLMEKRRAMMTAWSDFLRGYCTWPRPAVGRSSGGSL